MSCVVDGLRHRWKQAHPEAIQISLLLPDLMRQTATTVGFCHSRKEEQATCLFSNLAMLSQAVGVEVKRKG